MSSDVLSPGLSIYKVSWQSGYRILFLTPNKVVQQNLVSPPLNQRRAAFYFFPF